MNELILTVLFAAVFLYFLYGVVRAAVRDGILQADERRAKARGSVQSPAVLEQPEGSGHSS